MATTEYWQQQWNEAKEIENQLQVIRDWFSDENAHINFRELEDNQIVEFIERPYVKERSFEGKMLLFVDYILSQDLCEVVE